MKALKLTPVFLTGLALTMLAGCGEERRAASNGSNGTGPGGEGGAGADGSGGDSRAGVDSSDSGPSSDSGGSRASSDSGGSGPTSSGGGSGSPGSSGGSSGTRVDFETYCSEIADQYFDWLANCYGTMPYPESYREHFTTSSRERCMRAQGSIEAGRLGFDGIQANLCLEAIDVRDCDGFLFIQGIEECRNLFTSLVGQGEDCYPDSTAYFSITGASSECRDGYCDTATGQACPGTCAPLKSNGVDCTGTWECQPESYCNGMECRARVGLDAQCASEEECLDELYCYYPAGGEVGVCKEPSASGDACSDSNPCSGGYFCLTGECQSKAESGEECAQHHQCWNDERCIDRDGSGSDPRTCGEPGSEGTPCGSNFDCQDAFFCDTTSGDLGSCLAKLAIGQPCAIDGSCVAAAYCNQETGECQAVGEEGASCLVFDSPWLDEACAGGLACMSNGECHPALGEPGDPCRTTNETSCGPDLFCSRETYLCEPAGTEGEFCNPFWRASCEGDLACVCSGAQCAEGADASVHDTLHTCQPRRSPGDPCFHDYECPEDAFCQESDGGRTCVSAVICI